MCLVSEGAPHRERLVSYFWKVPFLCCSLRRRFGNTLGWQGVIGCGRSVTDFSRVSGGFTQGGEIIPRRLITELEDTEDGSDSFLNLIDGTIFLRVDLLK